MISLQVRRRLAARLSAIGLLCAASSAHAGAFRDHVVWTAGVRVRAEAVDYFAPPPAAAAEDAAAYAFGASQVRAGVRVTFPQAQFQVELQDTRLFGLPEDASRGAPYGNLGPGAIYYAHTPDRDQGSLFVKQAHATFRRSGFAVTAGRFEIADGLETVPGDQSLAWLKRARVAERLIGPFGYTHASRGFDGARLSYDRPAWNVTGFGARPTRGGYDVHANGGLEDVGLAGGALTSKRGPWAAPTDARAFYVYYADDRRTAVKVDNRPLAARTADPGGIRVHTGGAHLAVALSAGPGTADVLLWGALQGGAWGRQDHRAWAGAAEAGYQWRALPGAPWLRVGYGRSSGDANAADGEHRTFFQVIPTPRIYAQFPFFNLMNSEDRFAQLLLTPHARVQVRADVHDLRLVSAADLWYAGGGATNARVFGFSGTPSGGARPLARLLDLGVTVKLHPRVSAYAYAARALGRDVVRATFPRPDASYGYFELAFRY